MKTSSSLRNALNTILLCLMFVAVATAQAPIPTASAFEKLGAEEGGAMKIEIDLTELINNKNTNKYFPASLTLANGQQFKIEARARGKYRRKFCEIPPLKLKFSKKELRAAHLDTLNEIKLVTPCFNDPESQNLIFKEYMAYRIFEKLSPHGARARLIQLTFRDTHVEKEYPPMYCLLVEHEEEIAARLHGKMIESYNVKTTDMDMEEAALTVMFEYMIGNTDWEISTFRNVYLVQDQTDGLIRLVPYDFDFSGLVGAPYAIPASTSGLKKVQDRLLMADGISPEAMKLAIQKIRASKSEITSVCSSPLIPRETYMEVMTYLDSFFKVIEAKDTVPERLKAK